MYFYAMSVSVFLHLKTVIFFVCLLKITVLNVFVEFDVLFIR